MKNVRRFYAFITGMLLAFDFSGIFACCSLPRTGKRSAGSDLENLTADWIKVGNDFRKVIRRCHE